MKEAVFCSPNRLVYVSLLNRVFGSVNQVLGVVCTILTSIKYIFEFLFQQSLKCPWLYVYRTWIIQNRILKVSSGFRTCKSLINLISGVILAWTFQNLQSGEKKYLYPIYLDRIPFFWVAYGVLPLYPWAERISFFRWSDLLSNSWPIFFHHFWIELLSSRFSRSRASILDCFVPLFKIRNNFNFVFQRSNLLLFKLLHIFSIIFIYLLHLMDMLSTWVVIFLAIVLISFFKDAISWKFWPIHLY